MTKHPRKDVGRAARLALSALAIAASALAACSSSERPPAGGGGAPNTSGGPGGPLDAGALDGADAARDASASCNPIPNKAPTYPLTFSTAPRPPAFVGGAIEDGTYFQTSEVRYAQPGAMPAVTAPGITVTITGTDMLFGAYTTEKEYVPKAALITVTRADGGAGDAGADAGDTGDTIEIRNRCPIAGSSLGPQPYSVVGKDLTIGFGTYTVTYTKQ